MTRTIERPTCRVTSLLKTKKLVTFCSGLTSPDLEPFSGVADPGLTSPDLEPFSGVAEPCPLYPLERELNK